MTQTFRADLAQQIPTYKTTFVVHAEAIVQHGTALTVRDRAADQLDDARARAQAEERSGDLAREQRAALVHLAVLPQLDPFREARDRYTGADTELERTRVLERGEREILRSLRVLVSTESEER